jgi:hypothetical protein
MKILLLFLIASWLFTFIGCFFLRLFQWLSPLKYTAELRVLLIISYFLFYLMLFFNMLVRNRYDIGFHDFDSLNLLIHEIGTSNTLVVSGAIGVLLIIFWRIYFRSYYATYRETPLVSYVLFFPWNFDKLLVFLRKYLQKHFPANQEVSFFGIHYFTDEENSPFLCLEWKKLAKYLPIYHYELSFQEHPQINNDAFRRLARAIYREIPWNWIRNLVLPLLLIVFAFLLNAISGIEWDILVPFLVFCIWGGLFFPLIEPQRNKNFDLFLLRKNRSSNELQYNK